MYFPPLLQMNHLRLMILQNKPINAARRIKNHQDKAINHLELTKSHEIVNDLNSNLIAR